MRRYACFALAALLCGGCGGPGSSPAPPGGPVELGSYDSFDEAFALPPVLDELEPCSEFDEAVRQGEAGSQCFAGPAGPITEAKCRRWTSLAQLRLDLKLARLRAHYLRQVVEQLKQCEQQYLDRVGNGSLYRGENAARQLTIFRRLRRRFGADLAGAERRAGDLGEQLARLEKEEPAEGWLAAEGGQCVFPNRFPSEEDS
ncbi:MAG: hypothetical protein ABIP48_31240 [Planctomycetota bacterium]